MAQPTGNVSSGNVTQGNVEVVAKHPIGDLPLRPNEGGEETSPPTTPSEDRDVESEDRTSKSRDEGEHVDKDVDMNMDGSDADEVGTSDSKYSILRIGFIDAVYHGQY